MLPQIVIIGRPNVGKSTLFNRLVGKKLALVDDQPGVTRDRRSGEADLLGLKFEIVDTAGYEDEDPASLPGRMRQQTEAAIRGACAALFVVDARSGLTPLDEEIGRWLRSSKTPVILLANKAEGRAAEAGLIEAYSLGMGEPVAVSAEHGEGMADLFAALQPHIEAASAKIETAETPAGPLVDIDIGDLDDSQDEIAAAIEARLAELDAAPLHLAIVGRPNAGKSTLINRIIGEDRLITGPEAGITRDSISVPWSWQDRDGKQRPVKLVDTAGMRKRARVIDRLEKLSVADARRAIDFSEVVVLLLDATRGLEVQDLKIASQVEREGRALVIAINKWDIAEDPSALFNGVREALGEGLSQLRGVPLVSISAVTGKGIDALLQAAFDIRRLWSRRIRTGLLNRWFEDALSTNPPPAPGGKRIKLRYITQNRIRPPGFVIFGSRLDHLPASYERYLLNSMRNDLGFEAVPLRLSLRNSKSPFSNNKRGRSGS